MNDQANRPADGEKKGGNNNRSRHKNNRKPYYMKEKSRDQKEGDGNAQRPEGSQPAKKNEARGDRQGQPRQERQGQQGRQGKQPRQNQPADNGSKEHRESGKQQNTENRGNQQGNGQGNNQSRDRRGHNRHRRPDRRRENEAQKQSEPIPVAEQPTEEIILPPVGEFEPNPMIEDESTPEILISIEDEEKPEEDVPTVTVAGIRFKSGGKVYYFDKGALELRTGMYVIVETARGAEFGEVAFGNRKIRESTIVLPLRAVLRVATPEDIQHHKDNKRLEEEAHGICLEKIKKHGLDMKLIEVQYSFDNSKLLFYFTSASRVDFRELVKDLAGVFKTRIELRQIGIRDEAKIMGGLGACGRPLCCSTFLSDFVQVSIKMAKEQNLSLNSGKISGVCGRLMCCLQYEYKTYLQEGAKNPPVDSTVKTKDGVGYVTEVTTLTGKLKVKLKDKPDSPPQIYHRDEVQVIAKPGQKKDND